MKLKQHYIKVKKLLEEQPNLRFSDAELYGEYTEHPEVVDVLKETNYESIRRVRARIFEEHPHLKPPKDSLVGQFREQNKEEYLEFLRTDHNQSDLFQEGE